MRTSAMTQAPSPWDWEFDWHLTNRCNFYCEYCHPQIRYVLNRKHLSEPDPELVVRRFDELGRVCLVHMSGGEPFMFPGFVPLCQGLSKGTGPSISAPSDSTGEGDKKCNAVSSLHPRARDDLP